MTVALVANAQGVGSSRGLSNGEGSNSIQGRVHFPAGEQNKGKSIKLHLESENQIAGMSAVTDSDGAFRFNGLVPGSYTVVVDGGKEYENTRESVNIERGGGRDTQVNIQLRPRIDASNEAFAGIPKPALEAYQKGTVAAQKGDSKVAVQFLTEAVAAAPNFAMALNDLGSQYQKQFQWSKASETFEALVKLKPADASAQLNLGIALYNEGVGLMDQQKYEDAEKKFNGCETHLREAVNLKSPGPAAHYYLGMMLLKFKAYDEAQKELELAISNGGENLPLAHRYLAGAYINTHKNKEAADELEKYLKLEPKTADAEKIRASIKDLRSKQ
jgi:tetratricopeptide (TPR) repeat protein